MGTLEIEAIKEYLLSVGCKIEYPILVNAFKKHLYNPDPNVQGRVRTQFKDYVNRLATVSLENNMKFIILRPEFRTASDHVTPRHGYKQPPLPLTPISQSAPAPLQPRLQSLPMHLPPQPPPPLLPPLPPPPQSKSKAISQQQFGTPIRASREQTSNNRQDTPRVIRSKTTINDDQLMPPPRPPPRRRQSTASLFKPLPNEPIEKSGRDTNDLGRKSATGRVKEHAHRYNSSASTNDLSALMPKRNGSMKENRLSRDLNNGGLQRNGSQLTTRSRSSHRGEDESDSSSLQPIDPLRRKWAIEACNCNYDNLVTLLQEDPKLASCKDIVNGYTALHWAAKFGNLNIIRLIAGSYGVSANTKSSAGYTPLHVAYMFNRSEVANLLLQSYQASLEIRDHSGKRPKHYWQNA